jgi:hypothetical protein
VNPYHKYKQRNAKAEDQFPNVELISHHIPKTAGTSFYKTLTGAYGEKKVMGVYDLDMCVSLIREEPVWVPSEKTVLHGHFPARPFQLKQFPNAKHIIWIRDPIERAWSNLRHWIANESGEKYPEFKAKYMEGRKCSMAELFDNLVRDPFFHDIVGVYKIAFKAMKPADFHFIGRSENYDEEIVRLGELLGKQFSSATENTSKIAQELPFKREDYLDVFASEYEFLRKWYDKDYGL